MSGSLDDARRPLLVGIGTCSQRQEQLALSREPLDLMIEAAQRALQDAGARVRGTAIGRILVPRGRWRYRNPAREIARAIGAPQARTVLASVGVLQQSLIADACTRIGSGDIEAALVVGGDAGHRMRQAQRAGTRAPERQQDDEPDERWEPQQELLHPAELAAGIRMPVALYAVIESALRARDGTTLDQHAHALADMMAAFSQIGAGNPQAWRREAAGATEIAAASARNPLQAYPYHRLHCADWNVDQAGALLLCSAGQAAAWNLDPARWVHAWGSAESNHMQPVSARERIDQAPGAALAAGTLLEASGMAAADIDLLDLYSCFPAAVRLHADAVQVRIDGDRPLTVTGGLPFAGGPFNNYVLQATCRMAALLRQGSGTHGLVSSVSGILTKHGFGLWSREPQAGAFVGADVTEQVARTAASMPVLMEHEGQARIVGLTVVRKDAGLRALALGETATGARFWAHSHEPAVVDAVQREEWVGRPVRIQGSVFHPL